MNGAKFVVLGTEPLFGGALVIQDVGSDCKSVTNDAEAVVKVLLETKTLRPEQRLFYYDSAGSFDELLHDGKQFTGFKHHETAHEREVRRRTAAVEKAFERMPNLSQTFCDACGHSMLQHEGGDGPCLHFDEATPDTDRTACDCVGFISKARS